MNPGEPTGAIADEDPEAKARRRRSWATLGVGVVIGAGLGAALGMALESLLIGIPLGVALGSSLSLLFMGRAKGS